MPDPPKPDLDMLGEAMEDHSGSGDWWYDPATGEAIHVFDDMVDVEDGGESDPEAAGWVRVEPTEGRDGYRDMEDFIESLPDPGARSTLERAISGKGAFRRFKDVLFGTFPELGPAWHEFKDSRKRERAIAWLEEAGLIQPGTVGVDDGPYRAAQRARQQEREAELGREALAVALGRARAVAQTLATHDAERWGEVQRLLDEADEAAARAARA
jgi:hypothetical protein